MKITISNLAVGYRGGKPVVAGIDAVLRQGEMTCLIGRNGSGKSTVLKTLAGFLPRLGGELSVDGHDLERMSQSQRARLIGIVLTNRAEAGNLTVREAVALGRTPHTGFFGRLAPEDDRIVSRAMSMTGVDVLSARRLGTLSDGELQKTMIARTLAQETPIILLDEPTAFLDYASKLELFGMLAALSSEKLIILSTHDLELVARFADRIFEINHNTMLPLSPADLRRNISARMINTDAQPLTVGHSQ